MASKNDLAIIRRDPAAFRAAVLIETNDGPRSCADCLDAFQRQDFFAMDHAWMRVAGIATTPKYSRAWLERPRGHSKTADLALMVTWALFAAPTIIKGVVAAADKDQADLLRAAISRIVQHNPFLRRVLDVQATKVLNKETGSECLVLNSDAPSSYGLTPDFVVCDEITHWRKRDLWDSLFSAAAKRSNCVLLVICNAGYKAEWQWPLREAIRENGEQDGWYFNSLDGPQASWISEKHLAEQRRLLPAKVFDRLWVNRWVDGSGDALEEADIAAACTLKGPAEGREKGWIYIAGCDLGLKRDATAIATIAKHVGYSERIAGDDAPLPPAGPLADLMRLGVFDDVENDYSSYRQESKVAYHQVAGTGKCKLVDLQVLQPMPGKPIEVTEVEQRIHAVHKRFGLTAIGCDKWQAEMLIERLNQSSMRAMPIDSGTTNQRSFAEATISAFRDRTLEIYGDSILLADLRALRVVEKSYGIRLESPRNNNGGTRHGDTASALAIVLHVAKSIYTGPQFETINRPLVCWPPA